MNQKFHPVKAVPAPRAVTVHQAVENSPTLGRLAELVRESGDRLHAIERLIPEALRPAVQAGPIDGDTWCLLVSGNAAAAKLRQLLPRMQAALHDKGWKVTSIRLKILIGKK
ncbi:MAG: hypothetical protein JWQ72_779 [Polaromonas sp.]|nr:hypothetical protein [Polaromonas sp.]